VERLAGDLVFNPAAATESIDVPIAKNPDGLRSPGRPSPAS